MLWHIACRLPVCWYGQCKSCRNREGSMGVWGVVRRRLHQDCIRQNCATPSLYALHHTLTQQWISLSAAFSSFRGRGHPWQRSDDTSCSWIKRAFCCIGAHDRFSLTRTWTEYTLCVFQFVWVISLSTGHRQSLKVTHGVQQKRLNHSPFSQHNQQFQNFPILLQFSLPGSRDILYFPSCDELFLKLQL